MQNYEERMKTKFIIGLLVLMSLIVGCTQQQTPKEDKEFILPPKVEITEQLLQNIAVKINESESGGECIKVTKTVTLSNKTMLTADVYYKQPVRWQLLDVMNILYTSAEADLYRLKITEEDTNIVYLYEIDKEGCSKWWNDAGDIDLYSQVWIVRIIPGSPPETIQRGYGK